MHLKNVQTKDALKDLRCIAECTILEDLDISPDLKERILTHLESTPSPVQVNSKRRVKVLVTLSIAVVGALTAIGVLYSQHTKPKVDYTTLFVAETSLPVAASAWFQKVQLRTGNHLGFSSALPT
ncbi:hypothetical protein [Alicyclobacillus acidoterrestris]|uniref:Uncharacterized protein n=1 Tax=Alicyclobacillus acidoterrestris (strain ATCC 49025 / DSM 3922 / CIP 106132 / NCIMB 13137 / GD3B) TaxID=1356854 RepID=T0C9I7_ALIAG|nr:hypothetical protein [Alicyclobacillus acidoterrestris]EPZ52843.1 hypothetical protein N007_19235 [Alicyclobacillus acidoterrestris ATCC 49025]UNO47843.1 hypothetical protein K1I37_14270 [Alicyclobacillus acidoterrestris]GEO27620.1 hypothetical protein AAC03nite_34050 [Alicyclobacillus acidoterrestris]